MKNWGSDYSYTLRYHNEFESWEPTPIRLIAWAQSNLEYAVRNKDGSWDDCPTGYYVSCAPAQVIIDLLDGKQTYRDFDEFVRAVFDSVFESCQRDFEYYYSEESFRESADANNWEFYEDGTWA